MHKIGTTRVLVNPQRVSTYSERGAQLVQPDFSYVLSVRAYPLPDDIRTRRVYERTIVRPDRVRKQYLHPRL